MLFLENPTNRQISVVLRGRTYRALPRDERILDEHRDNNRLKHRYDLANAVRSKDGRHRRNRLDLDAGATMVIGDDDGLSDEILDILDQREALEALGVIVTES